MTPTQRYTLQQHDGPYAAWPLTSALRLDGQDTGQRVPGFVIDAQYDTPLGALLITSWDCLFEEANDFLLLGSTHRVVARKQLSRRTRLTFCTRTGLWMRTRWCCITRTTCSTR